MPKFKPRSVFVVNYTEPAPLMFRMFRDDQFSGTLFHFEIGFVASKGSTYIIFRSLYYLEMHAMIHDCVTIETQCLNLFHANKDLVALIDMGVTVLSKSHYDHLKYVLTESYITSFDRREDSYRILNLPMTSTYGRDAYKRKHSNTSNRLVTRAKSDRGVREFIARWDRVLIDLTPPSWNI